MNVIRGILSASLHHMLMLLNLLFITAFATSWNRDSLIRDQTLISLQEGLTENIMSASNYSD